MRSSKRYLVTLFGLHRPAPEILGSISLALITFTYAFTASSFSNLRTFILLDNITYGFVMNQTITSVYIDQLLIVVGTFVWLYSFLRKGKSRFFVCTAYGILILVAAVSEAGGSLLISMALTSVPIIAGALIYNNFAPRDLKILRWRPNLSLNYILVISVIIGILSLIYSFALLLPYISMQRISFVHDYAYEIFLMLSAFSPVFVIILVFCIPIKLVVNRISKWNTDRRHNRDHAKYYNVDLLVKGDRSSRTDKGAITTSGLTGESLSANNMSISLTVKTVCIALSMILSILLASIPHNPAVNSNDSIIGVDTHYYITWNNNMTISAQEGPLELVGKAFFVNRGDRPLTLLIVYAFVNFFGSTQDVPHTIDNGLPLVLSPVTVLAIYFMTRQLTSNDLISIFAAFLTAVSYHILIGIYAGFFANWIALILGYVSIGFIFRFLNKSKKLDLVFLFVGMTGLMLTHIYTWTVFIVIITVFLLLMLKVHGYHKGNILILLIIVLSTIAIDASKSAVLGTRMGVQHDLRFVSELGLDTLSFEGRWENLTATTQQYLGGLFANPIILLLGIYWLVRCNYKNPGNILLLLFLSTGIAPLFVGDWMVQARFLYDAPLQIPAAIALVAVSSPGKNVKENNPLQRGGELSVNPKRMFVLFVFLWLISVSIKGFANLPP